MGSANVNNEDTVSGILIAGEPLTHLRDENILEPGPEDGPIGRYIRLDMAGPMERFHFALLPNCPQAPSAAPGCRPFFARFNRIAVLHRLAATHLRARPPNIRDYPDNLYWHQPGEMSEVCFLE
jgi:hypothetical protein